MSRSIRTKVSNTINTAVYNDNQIRVQFENMELYDSVNQQLNEIQEMIDTTTIYINNTAITDLSNLKIETAALAVQNSIIEPSIASVQSQVNGLVSTTTSSDVLKINKDDQYFGNIVLAGNVQVQSLNVSGLVRVDANGNILPSSGSTVIINSDIAVGAGIIDSKLATISDTGKVAVSATSATVASVPNTILLRDSSGHLFAKTQTNITDMSDTTITTTAYVKNAYSAIIGSSPGTLDTLNELAAALGDDSNYAVNVMNAISTKSNLTNPVLTGNTVMSNVFVAGLQSTSSAILSTNGVGLLGKTSFNTALASVVVPDNQLAAITTPGKVQDSALNVSVEPSANTIVLRDSSGNLGSAIVSNVLIQNKNLIMDASYTHIAGPYSQGCSKLPMPSKAIIDNATKKWVLRAGVNANPCAGLCWSPEVGRFVGVGYSQYVVSSKSGITWEQYDSQINNNWNDVVWAYDLNRFVAVASSGTNNRVMTSIDASNWSPQNTSGLDYSWSAITYSDELKLLVAVSTDAGNSIMTSTDAISWTMRPYSGTYGLRCVCWSKELNMFVAPEYNVGGATSIAISYNGTTWSQVSSVLTSATYWSVCWSPERRLFVVVGGTNNIAISSDGLNWTNQTIANAQGILQKVVWCPQFGVFVAICSNAANRNLFWVSETGLAWRSVQAPVYPSSPSLNSLTLVWSPELSIFCTITSNGTLQEKVLTSSLKSRLVNPTTVFNSPFMSIDNSGNWTIPKMSTGGVRVNNIATNGINNRTRQIATTNLNFTGTSSLSMQAGATPGYTLTSMDSSGTAMWLPYKTVPLQINANITSNATATWSNTGQTRTLGNIVLHPGNWSIYYKTAYAAEPTNGAMVPVGTISTEYADLDIQLKYGFDAIQGTNFANTASGTAVYDASGFNGASLNTTDFKVGTGSLNLVKSSSQYVQVPPFATNTNGITVCFWFKHNSNDTFSRIFDFGNGSPSNNILYSPIVGAYFHNTTGPILAGGPSFIQNTSKNVWHFFAWTIPYVSSGNTTHTFYFDGSSSTVSTEYPPIVTRNNNYFGRSNWVSDPYIDAQVDDFRWYNRALSASEINAIYTTTSPLIRYPPISNIIQPFNPYTLRLDGAKHLQLSDYLDFNLTGGTMCTLECWIYPTTYTNSGLVTKAGRYGLYMTSAGLIRVYDWTVPNFINSSITVPLNTWSHVAVTINSGLASGTTFYYNGVATGSAITYTFGSTTTNPVVIGGEGATKFIGYMSNARIWNTLRNSSEIGGNYNKLISSATGLIASLYLNDLPTTTRAANNVYPAQRAISRSIAGIYSGPDISTNAITASQTEDVRNIVFSDIATTGRGLEYVVPITNATDASAVYFLNSYIETNSGFNVGTGRTTGQTYLYAIREPTIDTTFYFKQYYSPVNYANFSSTTGLVLLSAASASAGDILLTPASTNQVGNVWTTWNGSYDADFKITFRMNLYSGSATPADGFCIQWNAANNVTGVIGGGCGVVTNSKYAIVFKTFTYNTIELFQDGTSIQSFPAGTSFYADVYYWVDYNYLQKKLSVYRSSANTKPAAPSYIFTNVDFPVATPYYIGFGAATGGSFEAHALKSFSLEIISYKFYWILPQVTPTNIGFMGIQGNSSVSQLDILYSGNSYDAYKANRLTFSNMYLNMNYLNGNYITYNNNGSFYYHHRDASNISFAAATRVYVRGYTGPVFQLRRSTDGALQDFYTDEYQTYLTTLPNGAGTTYATWVTGATAYIRTWYNQNGNSNNAINTTADTTQPILALDNGKYVVQWTAASVGGTFLRIPEPIQPNTIFCEFYNTNTTGSIACYVNTSGAAITYQQRFNGLSVIGNNTNNQDWYTTSVGTKRSYVDGTSATSLTAWGSWKTVALSTTSPVHQSGGFGFIGRDGSNTANSINGFMSQIVFHNKAMPVGSMVGFHTDRLIV